MKFISADGGHYELRRDWLPWERKSNLNFSEWNGGPEWLDLSIPDFDFDDDPISILLSAFIIFFYLIVLAFFIIFALPLILGLAFVGAELLLLASLTPFMIPLRSLFFPWKIKTYLNGDLIHVEEMKGLYASNRYMKKLRDKLQTKTVLPEL